MTRRNPLVRSWPLVAAVACRLAALAALGLAMMRATGCARDEESASHLARDLRAFAAEYRDGGFSLSFADARGHCPSTP